jgi:hypothetical protein
MRRHVSAPIHEGQKRKNWSNLISRCQIQWPRNFDNLDAWFRTELESLPLLSERAVLANVYENLNDFVRWPHRAILLWEGRDRSMKYHRYPQTIKLMAMEAKVTLDGRVNGPAIAAYRIAGGERPPRMGSKNGWSVHHVYSGKFPHPGKAATLHAAHDGRHCSQSAGLVAVHPVADRICDEYPFFTWLLRAMAYERFGYDPDEVFSAEPHDGYGFVNKQCFVVPITYRTGDAEP